MPWLSIPQPYLCNGIFISKEYSEKDVARSNWMHKTFCYFLVFVYRPNQWSTILQRRLRGNPYSAPRPAGSHLEAKLWDSVLAVPAPWFIYLSGIFCWADHYLRAGCLWIHPQNDMKAITLCGIWVISPQNRSDVSPEIAFPRLPELFNIVADCSCERPVGRQTDSWVLHMAVCDLSLLGCTA